jgi:hypothetical protein
MDMDWRRLRRKPELRSRVTGDRKSAFGFWRQESKLGTHIVLMIDRFGAGVRSVPKGSRGALAVGLKVAGS